MVAIEFRDSGVVMIAGVLSIGTPALLAFPPAERTPLAELDTRTRAQQKIDSQLPYEICRQPADAITNRQT